MASQSQHNKNQIMSEPKITITIDDQEYQVDSGQMLIEVTDQLGIHIPRFCYHEKLSIAANCRMCLVEVENSKNALPACATEISEGMVIKTMSKDTELAQQATMEFLLINHPLDCPICDQGGECELQDLAYIHGRNESRFEVKKRTLPDDNLGPLISTDMTRCILCTRCVRFGTEIAGLPELGTIGRGESSTISTFIEKTVDHELSGNMIDICPVGALNNKPYRYTDRTWELNQIESISPHDCVGTNMFLHVKGNKIKRIVPKDNSNINEVWISDRDRFAFDGIYSEDRLTSPMLRKNGTLHVATWEEAIGAFAKELASLQKRKKANEVAALISSSTALNEQYLYAQLFRSFGCTNLDHRIRQVDFSGDALDPIFPNFDIKPNQIENMNSILIIGSDLRKETPLIAHWVKKAADQGASVNFINQTYGDYYFPIENFILSDHEALAENLGLILKASYNDATNELPDHIVDILNALPTPTPSHYQIAQSLTENEQSFLLSGLQCHSHSQYALIRSYLNILSYITNSSLGELTYGANTVGAYLTGCIPHRKAFGESNELGLNALEICTKKHELITLYGIEPEDCLYQEELHQSIIESKTTVLFSSFITPFMKENADILFPIKTAYESKGTFINASGMIQNFNLQLELDTDNLSNQELLFQIFETSKLSKPSLGNLNEKIGKFIADTKHTQTRLMEFPEQSPNKIDNYSRIFPGPYSVDSITRRSKPLQNTKDALSEDNGDE